MLLLIARRPITILCSRSITIMSILNFFQIKRSVNYNNFYITYCLPPSCTLLVLVIRAIHVARYLGGVAIAITGYNYGEGAHLEETSCF